MLNIKVCFSSIFWIQLVGDILNMIGVECRWALMYYVWTCYALLVPYRLNNCERSVLRHVRSCCSTQNISMLWWKLGIIHTWTCTEEHVEHDYVLEMVSNGPLGAEIQHQKWNGIVFQNLVSMSDGANIVNRRSDENSETRVKGPVELGQYSTINVLKIM
jgi:hypothetical protein